MAVFYLTSMVISGFSNIIGYGMSLLNGKAGLAGWRCKPDDTDQKALDLTSISLDRDLPTLRHHHLRSGSSCLLPCRRLPGQVYIPHRGAEAIRHRKNSEGSR